MTAARLLLACQVITLVCVVVAIWNLRRAIQALRRVREEIIRWPD